MIKAALGQKKRKKIWKRGQKLKLNENKREWVSEKDKDTNKVWFSDPHRDYKKLINCHYYTGF